MQVSVIFQETLKLMCDRRRRIIHQGGQSSGKTVNILGAISTVLASPQTYGYEEPPTATVTSMSFPHLRAGAMRDFDKYVLPTFAPAIKQYRKSDHIIMWHSGAIMEFRTYETEYDARGPKRQILFVNEGNTFDYMTWWQLDSRSEVSIVDYNPTIRFWAHEKVIDEKGTALRISDHRHNPFLEKEKHNEIEGIKDKELWRVYARGLTGNVQGLIYPDWVLIDEIHWEEPFFAIDFGYTNDPTAVIKIEKHGEDVYCEEIAYKRGSMTAKRIREVLIANGYTDDSIVYCEHDPHMIKQLKMLDVRAVAAKKGSGSLNAGIEKLKEYNVFYAGRNIKDEKEKYIWEIDETGKPTNKPVDAHNHALDAIRYGVYSHFYRA
jgi:phage terminase large subunit